MFSKTFAVDLLERVLSTFAQAFLGCYAVVGAQKAVVAAGIAAGLSAMKGVAAVGVGQQGTAALLPAPSDAGHSSAELLLLVSVFLIVPLIGFGVAHP